MVKFQILTTTSTVNWTGKKILGLHTGGINIADGYINIFNGKIVGGRVNIDMTSITVTDIADPKTHKEFRDHLLHEDFFFVERFTRSTLVIKGSTLGEGNNQLVSGDLTIKGITHPIEFSATVEQFTDFLHSMGEIKVDRTLYDIRYGSGKFIPNLGDKLIHDEFVLQFKIIGQVTSDSLATTQVDNNNFVII